jgi:hypothetical protein
MKRWANRGEIPGKIPFTEAFPPGSGAFYGFSAIFPGVRE